MSPDTVRSGDAGAEDFSVLIKALREADQRLEDLTSGEVDTVADREGRSFLLHRAQDQLRNSESARQAAILNALPAHIALLNASGFIVSVNEAWRRFALANSGSDPDFSVGRNYLDVCDRALGTEAEAVRQVAIGIRAVLAGEQPAYSCEYPCHSPTEERWFLLNVTTLAGHERIGAVVMHLDITGQKRGAAALRRFAGAMDAIEDGIYLVNRASMQLVHVNEAACLLHRKSREQLLASPPWLLVGGSRAELELNYDRIIASGAAGSPVEVQRTRADGSPGWLELRCHAQRTAEQWTLVTLVRDITGRKQAEQRIVQLNRVYAMLSGINTLIVRVRVRDELFREACRIATEAGGFRMAWIGMLEAGSASVVPVSWSGMSEAMVARVRERLGDTQQPGSVGNMTMRALGSGEAVLVSGPGRNSLAILPLIVAGSAVGVVALYASAENFFQEDEMLLLNELTGDVAFAIDHIEKQERLNYLAYYDTLTGLANRSLFLERVAQELRTAADNGRRVAVLTLDLERFRNINDTLGLQAGDALLRQVAAWLQGNVGAAEQLTRGESDHFALMVPDVEHDGDVTRVLDTLIVDLLAYPFELGGAEIHVTARIGIALFPDDGGDAETLFRNAEAALKKAKAGGERFLFYTQKMSFAVAGRLTLENQLRQALAKQEFVLHYQPKVSVADGEITGAEALIRWHDPLSGMVPPARFIPILEETGLIHEVGQWALHQAIGDYLRWDRAGLAPVRLAVNVSPLQLRSHDFIAQVTRAVGIAPNAVAGLELEITESLIMEDIDHSRASLQAIRDLGVTMAIDDFGTGFSSLSYLARLAVDTLKIDRAFVVAMTAGAEGQALVAAIINLAHSLRMKVVAEGVETDEQLRLLRLLDCDEAQGYLFSKPLPAGLFAAQFLAHRILDGAP